MVDYKTFKKGYLNEWVDQSQAARKAAEELAMKEVKPSLQDKYAYKDINQDLIFILNGHKVEFKAENEKKADGDIYFTWYEAIERFGEPDFKNGWRLPTKEEFGALCKYPHEFKDEQGVFDNRLYLPLAGYCGCNGNVFSVGFRGFYWSSTLEDSDCAWYLYFYSGGVDMSSGYQCNEHSVRLVRDIK
jgi:hypothetical protein